MSTRRMGSDSENQTAQFLATEKGEMHDGVLFLLVPVGP